MISHACHCDWGRTRSTASPVAVIACIAAMSPSSVPNLSFTTFETRARQVVVHTAPPRTPWNTSRVLRHWRSEAASSLLLLHFAKRGMTAMRAICSFKNARAQSPLFQNGKGQQICTRVKDDPPSHHSAQACDTHTAALCSILKITLSFIVCRQWYRSSVVALHPLPWWLDASWAHELREVSVVIRDLNSFASESCEVVSQQFSA